MGRFRIDIDSEIVGFLTDEGEFISDNPSIKRFSKRVKKIGTFEMVHGKGAVGWVRKTVKTGDAGYVSAVIEKLLDAGYGVAPDTGCTEIVV